MYSASVQARIALTVVVVHVVSFVIHVAGAAARSYHHAVFVNTCHVVHDDVGLNSVTVTAHVLLLTLNTHVFDIMLLDTLIHVQAERVSCLFHKAVARFVLSVGCHAIFANVTVFQ